MRLAWGPDVDAFRAELVEFLEEHAPPEAKTLKNAGTLSDAGDEDGGSIIPDWARRWQATLFDHGWMVPGYPRHLGGRDATPVQTLVYLQEMSARGIPRSVHFPGYAIVAPSLLEFGDEAQRQLAPAAIRGDDVWCIGMSEPNAGSDLAGLQTRAVLDGDTFVVNGQKVWTSYAMVAERCFCYVRTDPAAPRHKGISVLIIDMATPGIEVRPLRQFSGAAHFAEVFFTDVVVPASNLVGEANDGWRITMGSLAHERGGLWVQSVSLLESTVDDLVALCRRRGLTTDAGVRRQLAEAYEQVSSLRALGYKGFTSFARTSSAPEHSYLKLATSELGKSLYELGMQLQGPDGVVLDRDLVPDAGRWVHSFFTSFANTIAGGTSEIQRNIIAERVLGLPRGA
ncbi:MAG TPA: acyl-CoA dehydrogenase family protein [Actinomycetota bacterium]|nr:acyl-CoA dehydrogenase family protein [Actinomycetota bacterium]